MQEPMAVEEEGHSKCELNVQVDISESTLEPSCSTREQRACLKCLCVGKINMKEKCNFE